MGRQVRIEYVGAVYHVMSRGNHQQAVFRSDEDCILFLKTLGEACERTGWRVHAYVLMGNHYHLLIETPEPNLISGMRWLQGTYTKRFNVRHKEWGHLFQGRYKALVIDSNTGEYFSTVANYIHLNPARIKGYDFKEAHLEEHRWSSYPAYLEPSARPDWLTVNRVLENLDFSESPAGLHAYQGYMERRMVELAHSKQPWEVDEQWKKIRRGWYLGEKDFREELLGRMSPFVEGKRRDSFGGSEIRLHDEVEAERLVQLCLKRLGMEEEQLMELRKGDVHKKVIAWYVRRKTSVKNEWISTRLQMGNSSNLSRYISEVKDASEGLLQTLKTTI